MVRKSDDDRNNTESLSRRLIIRNFPVEFDDDEADLLGIQESKSAQIQKKAEFDELMENVLKDYKEIADGRKDE